MLPPSLLPLQGLLWWYLLLCYASRTLVFRFAAVCAMLTVSVYCGCATAASLIRWPVVEGAAAAAAAVVSAVNASNATGAAASALLNVSNATAGKGKVAGAGELLYARLPSHAWYHATVYSEQTDNRGAMAVFLTAISLVYLCAYTLAYRAEQSERNAYVASVAVHSHFESDRDEETRLSALVKEILPPTIVPELKQSSSGTLLKVHPQTTVLVADIAGPPPPTRTCARARWAERAGPALARRCADAWHADASVRALRFHGVLEPRLARRVPQAHEHVL